MIERQWSVGDVVVNGDGQRRGRGIVRVAGLHANL